MKRDKDLPGQTFLIRPDDMGGAKKAVRSELTQREHRVWRGLLRSKDLTSNAYDLEAELGYALKRSSVASTLDALWKDGLLERAPELDKRVQQGDGAPVYIYRAFRVRPECVKI